MAIDLQMLISIGYAVVVLTVLIVSIAYAIPWVRKLEDLAIRVGRRFRDIVIAVGTFSAFAVRSVATFVESVVQSTTSILQTVADGFANASTFVSNTLAGLITVFSNMFAYLVTHIVSLPLRINTVIQTAGSLLTNSAADIAGRVFRAIVMTIIHAITFIIRTIIELLVTGFNFIVDAFNQLLAGIDFVLQQIAAGLEIAVQQVVDIANSIYNFFNDDILPVLNDIADIVGAIASIF